MNKTFRMRKEDVVRKWYHLENIVTDRHMNNMSKVLLATSFIVAYGYFSEFFFSYYSGNIFESQMMDNRTMGDYAPAFWMLIFCNVITPQALWFKSVRLSTWRLFAITLIVGVGMWLERFVIIATTLTRDFMPSSWGTYHGTFWDWATYLGTLGFFTFMMCLFIRFLPMIAVHEIRVSHHDATGRHQ